jgi:hypothetical protein
MKSFVLIMGTLIAVVLVHSPPQAQPACGVESLLQLPDVTITSITRETQDAPHCKIAGVIGPEIHFELHLMRELGPETLRRPSCQAGVASERAYGTTYGAIRLFQLCVRGSDG